MKLTVVFEMDIDRDTFSHDVAAGDAYQMAKWFLFRGMTQRVIHPSSVSMSITEGSIRLKRVLLHSVINGAVVRVETSNEGRYQF